MGVDRMETLARRRAPPFPLLCETSVQPSTLAVRDRSCCLEGSDPRAGARTVSGLEMLIDQGAAAFSLWTGRAAPVESMREVACAEISDGG